MYEKIIVPLDGSELAEAVLPWVERLAQQSGAELILTTVTELPERRYGVETRPGFALNPTAELAVSPPDSIPVGPVPVEGGHREYAEQAMEHIEMELKSYLSKIQERLSTLPVRSQGVVLWGKPAESIVDFAVHSGADMIAMATHGRSGVGRWVYGSVADKVLRGATMPVLLVRASASQRA